MITTTVFTSGNSLAVRIPKQTAKNQSLSHGSEVVIVEEVGRGITIVHTGKKKMTLKERIAGIKPGNRHADNGWLNAKAVGKEILPPWEK
jgi:antitoxin component of MazEF toxin-antitoxin module